MGSRAEFLSAPGLTKSELIILLANHGDRRQTPPVSGERGEQAASSAGLPSPVEPGPQAQGSEDPRGPCGARPLGVPKGSPVGGWVGMGKSCLLERITWTRSEIRTPFCPVGSTQAAKSPITKSPRCQFRAFLSCL